MPRIIDLFAGLGGIRLGFQQAMEELGLETECVFASEIKPYAIQAYVAQLHLLGLRYFRGITNYGAASS